MGESRQLTRSGVLVRFITEGGWSWTLTGFALTAVFVVSVTLRENRTSVGHLRFIHAGPGQFSTFAAGAEWIEKTFRQII